MKTTEGQLKKIIREELIKEYKSFYSDGSDENEPPLDGGVKDDLRYVVDDLDSALRELTKLMLALPANMPARKNQFQVMIQKLDELKNNVASHYEG